jgi:hypothetical protein
MESYATRFERGSMDGFMAADHLPSSLFFASTGPFLNFNKSFGLGNRM